MRSWLILALLLLAGGGVHMAGTAAPPPERVALVMHVEGAIGPATVDYLARGLAAAAERKATLVVLRMDTPGGLDTSMRAIIRDILASPVPVATYVSPSGARAASAGTYILYASHVAAMAPGTNLGAATPVSIGGGFPQPDRDEGKRGDKPADGEPSRPRSAMEAKVVSDATAFIRSLAELRGRNVEWAEKAVREAASLSARQALDQKVIEIVARTEAELLDRIDGRKVTIDNAEITLETAGLGLVPFERDWRTRLLAAITDPNVALILMMIGIYGIVFEFMNPGAVFPGTIGAICLLLGLYALAALPVNYAGLGLIVLGIALMVAEAHTPSFGVLGIGGGIAFVLGATILIDTDIPEFEPSWTVVGGVAAIGLGFALVVLRLAFASRRRPVLSGKEEMIGASGEVVDWDGTAGHVLAHGERWNAVSRASLVPGQQVRVAALDGLVLEVEPDGEPG